VKSLQGLLVDLDGVLYIEEQLIPGAVDTMDWLRDRGYPLRFLTNTTMRSRFSLVEKLRGFGIRVEPQEMFSTCVVAAHWLKAHGVTKVHLLLPRTSQEDFGDFQITDDRPEAVVVGDLGSDFSFDVLNHAFRLIRAGARLIALQKNRFWQRQDGLAMDVGAFVAALEYATEIEATVIGKPNRAYFEMALEDLGLPASEVAMIGDDIYTDIKGGKAVGLKTILVKTGKYAFDEVEKVDCQPDWVLESIADLPALLES
jgi:HAD superfamily hydrolase (TIGR01458 family)